MTPATSKPGRVLVADDHAINRMIASRQLKALGFSVDVVETGREALEAITRSAYDLVLMDCHMPEMDGFEATREIRRHEGTSRRTPIIAMTASVDMRDRNLCLSAGMDDFAVKPVSHEELLRLLQRWIFDADHPTIDPAKIEVLRATSEGLVGEVVEIFLGDAPGRIAAIRAALSEGDAKALSSAAHALRSGAANLGATRVFDLCVKLETMGRSGELEGAGKIVDDLSVEYLRAARALREL